MFFTKPLRKVLLTSIRHSEGMTQDRQARRSWNLMNIVFPAHPDDSREHEGHDKTKDFNEHLARKKTNRSTSIDLNHSRS